MLNIQQLGARPGRPITVPITYDDMMNVDLWEDSKFIFKKALEGDHLEAGGGFH